ncbi:MAG: cytochrome c3 family protein [Rhodocyclaceae bacterium]
MKGTRHDFTGSGFFVPISGVQVGLCTICHTPHSAYTTALLWNQKLTTATFDWGAATTSAGTSLPNSAHLGPTTKCLSCHDGTVSVGDISIFHEMPGGRGAPGDTLGIGTLIMRFSSGNVRTVGFGGNMSGVHPVAVPYPYNGAANTYNASTTGADVVLSEFVDNPHAPAAKSIKLYSTDGTGKVNTGPQAGATGIECSTCHDPHNRQTQDVPFLRGKIAGADKASGYICLQCHIK